MTLWQNYWSGYNAEVNGFGSGVTPANYPKKIDSYTLYNASVTYSGIKNLTVTAGLKNIFNTSPPFSAHNIDNVAGAGWDARVGDPRGRALTVRLNHKFF
jgi:iron complex outermembrane receptor protein